MAIYPLIREGLFCYSRGDAEKAHYLTIRALAKVSRMPRALSLIGRMQEVGNPKKITLFKTHERPNGVTFLKGVPGISAGFDKHAEAPVLCRSGASHVEYGSILPEQQTGNDRPRVFRIRSSNAIINRYGFNSHGAPTIAARLREHERKGLLTIPIGLNFGAMKSTPKTDISRVAKDYIEARSHFVGLGDYNVANVSSPNTENLRSLQYEIRELMQKIISYERTLYGMGQVTSPVPWLVKLAPDGLDDDDTLRAVVEGALEAGVEGLIVSNTTVTRPEEIVNHSVSKETGGLSGRLVYPLMMKLLIRVRRLTDVPIFASGGLDTTQKVMLAHDYGATMTQAYTPFVYEGPMYFRKMRRYASRAEH